MNANWIVIDCPTNSGPERGTRISGEPDSVVPKAFAKVTAAGSPAGQPQQAYDRVIGMADDPPEGFSTWPLLALASMRLGRRDEAGKWLAKAEAFPSGAVSGSTSELTPHPESWADFKLLLNEARNHEALGWGDRGTRSIARDMGVSSKTTGNQRVKFL